MLKPILFYIFNILAVWIIKELYFIYGNDIFNKIVKFVGISCIIQTILAILLTTGTGRATALFNNPNQLGLYALISLTYVLMLNNFISKKVLFINGRLFFVLSIIAASYLILISLSKAAVIGAVVLLIIYFFMYKRKYVLKLLLILLVLIIVLFNMGEQVINNIQELPIISSAINRIGSIDGEEDSDLGSGRGYDRIKEIGVQILYGTGEGANYRFAVMNGSEIHSAYASLLCYYGIIGICLFLIFFINSFPLKREYLKYYILFIGIILYGFTHQIWRNTLLWILLEIVAIICLSYDCIKIYKKSNCRKIEKGGVYKMKKSLVSVIIPTYNCDKYIEGCIETIENQTYDNIEIIICDDCSTDNTKKILDDLEKKYDNIKVLYNEKNLKAAATRNKCIEYANGEFIAIQDADDYSDKRRIEKQVAFLNENPSIGYVSASVTIIDETGEKGVNVLKNKFLSDKDFYKGLPFAHPATLFRKEAIDKVNGYRVDKTTVRGEDYDMFLRMQIAGIQGATISDPLYYYREDDSAFKRRKYRYRIDGYKIRKMYFKQMDLNFFERLYRFKPLIVGLIPTKLQKKYRRFKEKKTLKGNTNDAERIVKKAKVAQVIKKMDIGGIETFLMNVCRNIDYDKFQVDFIYFDEKPGVYDSEIIKLGCNIHYVCKKSGVISHMLSLKRTFKQGRYDVVHAHSSFYNGIILLAAKLAKVKLKVSHAHGTGDNKKQTVLRKIYAFFSRLCIRKCANIFCACSKEAGNFLYGKDIKNLNVIENGIDINKFKYDQCKRKELREKLCVNDDKIIIGHVGRFSKEKNHKFILEIFSKLNKINPNTELWLIGEGTLYNSIEEEIRKNNMDSKVKLFGNTSEVELYLSAMDVFIFPSIHEGLGISLIEAQCSGVKCVVSDAIPELAIINSNVIKLCLSGSEDRWISELLDKGKRIEHIDYEKFKYFDIKNSIKKIEEIYKNV